LSPETRKKLESKGIKPSIIGHILEYAAQVNNFKDCFETMENHENINKVAIKEIEKINSAIKDICRIPVAYYQFEPPKRDEFNFYCVLRNL